MSDSESDNEIVDARVNIVAKIKNNKETFDRLKKVKSFSKSISLDDWEEKKENLNEEIINKQSSFDQG